MSAIPVPSKYVPDITDFSVPVAQIRNTVVFSTGSNSVVNCSTVSQFTRGCSIAAWSKNTGSIYIGGQSVNPNNGYELTPGSVLAIGTNDLCNLYVAFDNSGDQARIIFGS